MQFISLIKNFCSSHEECEFYDNYSGKFMFGRTCPAIVVKAGSSFMDVLINLTAYLTEVGYDDTDFNLDATSVDELGLDKVIYFPNCSKK